MSAPPTTPKPHRFVARNTPEYANICAICGGLRSGHAQPGGGKATPEKREP